MERLTRVGEAGLGSNPPAYGCDISGARPCLGAAKRLDQLRMIALCFSDIGWI